MPDCTAEERATMPGYLTQAQIQQVRTSAAEQFDAQFTATMTLHHKGAVRMADLAWRGRGDVRLRIMAHAIRHEQQDEIALKKAMIPITRITSTDAAVHTLARRASLFGAQPRVQRSHAKSGYMSAEAA